MTRIGIVSDTHGDVGRLEAALTLLARQNVEIIVHCGDIGSAACVEAMGEAKAFVYAVAGNCDTGSDELPAAARRCGVHLAAQSVVIPLQGGLSAVATHGHDKRLLDQFIEQGKHAYVLHGHTHRTRDERIGGTRVINPGALHRSQGSVPTVAVLDSVADTVEYLSVSTTD